MFLASWQRVTHGLWDVQTIPSQAIRCWQLSIETSWLDKFAPIHRVFTSAAPTSSSRVVTCAKPSSDIIVANKTNGEESSKLSQSYLPHAARHGVLLLSIPVPAHRRAYSTQQSTSSSNNKSSAWRKPPVTGFLPSYAQLASEASAGDSWKKRESKSLSQALDFAFSDAELSRWAGDANISKVILQQAKDPFKVWLKARLRGRAKESILSMPASRRRSPSLLWPLIKGYASEHFAAEIQAQASVRRTADMSKPHLWFPHARELPRKVIYHAGPTNSGKTYNALRALKKSGCGLYCGPLRLLAVEVYDRLNSEGFPCKLLTGQERIDTPGADHTACTVEMASTSNQVDVAVVDEIQLMADPQRGWAWTKAVLGIPCRELHVCGDSSAMGLVESLCNDMGSSLEVKEYARMTRLDVEEHGLGRAGYKAVQSGDCIIAFSRKEIYRIKAAIERQTEHKACVIYGALPAETRRAQAKLFNDPSSDFSVLVASDAVGMGLNLNIRRIIFHSMRRYSSAMQADELLHPSAVKQIAGRAGRRGTQHEDGLVTTFWDDEVAVLRAALDIPPEAHRSSAAGLLPEYEQLEQYALRKGYPESCTFAELLESFAEESKQDKSYFLCNQQDMVELAKSIEGIHPLSLQERFTLCKAPVNQRVSFVKNAFLCFATEYAQDGFVELEVAVPEEPPSTWPQISHCEHVHSIASLWLWLSFRFGDAFVNRERVQVIAQELSMLVNTGLQRVSTDLHEAGRGAYTRADIFDMLKIPAIGLAPDVETFQEQGRKKPRKSVKRRKR